MVSLTLNVNVLTCDDCGEHVERTTVDDRHGIWLVVESKQAGWTFSVTASYSECWRCPSCSAKAKDEKGGAA